VHHGLANAIALPHVIRFTRRMPLRVYAELARALGVSSSKYDEEATEALAKGVTDLSQRVGLPLRYRDVGVPEDDLPAIAELAVTDGSIVYTAPGHGSRSWCSGVLKAAW